MEPVWILKSKYQAVFRFVGVYKLRIARMWEYLFQWYFLDTNGDPNGSLYLPIDRWTSHG